MGERNYVMNVNVSVNESEYVYSLMCIFSHMYILLCLCDVRCVMCDDMYNYIGV